MSNYFVADLGTTSVINLGLRPFNNNDSYVYLEITGYANYSMQPSTQVRAMVTPALSSPSVATASGLLEADTRVDVYESGYFFAEGGENNTDLDDDLSFSPIKISGYDWENTSFNLHWLILRGSDRIYGSNLSGVYTLPHNIQSKEVQISGNLINTGNEIDYEIHWSPITNDTSAEYGSVPTDGPYKLLITYKFQDEANTAVAGFTSFVHYPAGTMDSGIYVTLPFYDARNGFHNVPTIYNLHMCNVTCSGTVDSTPYVLTIDHQQMLDSNKYFKNLDEAVFSSADIDNLKKIPDDSVRIPEGVINRKRLSIGINDIALKNNTYEKQGTYVSPFYPLDFNMYTFSLKVDEFIPKYDNLNPYNVIKYYVEFNSNKWEPISPITRGDEFLGKVILPKLYIFDSGTEEVNTQVKYLNYSTNINGFRIKIVFDLSSLSTSKFIPPEVRDYKCIIYSKDQFFNL